MVKFSIYLNSRVFVMFTSFPASTTKWEVKLVFWYTSSFIFQQSRALILLLPTSSVVIFIRGMDPSVLMCITFGRYCSKYVGTKSEKKLQYNLNRSNTDGSFTVVDSSFFRAIYLNLYECGLRGQLDYTSNTQALGHRVNPDTNLGFLLSNCKCI